MLNYNQFVYAFVPALRSQSLMRNWPLVRGQISCLSTKDKKYLMHQRRFVLTEEKFALQGVPLHSHVTTGLDETDKCELVGNMFNGFAMAVMWASFFGNFSFTFD